MSFHEITAKFRRWKAIRETVAALEGLPTDELNDLGIGRWRIPALARSTAG